MVTDGQVRVLRRKLLMEGKTQEAAAAGAGMSVRSARHWQAGPYPSQAHKPHLWRTRPDPLAGVFDSDIAPLLAADERRVLEARTLLGELDRRHPGCFSVSQLRTLQRRIREWRAMHGPEQEVYFPQDHPPGREAAFDFTNCNDLGVTIGGEPFAHLLFELALSYSGWRWQMVAASESFEALAAGVQGALWELGGVSEVLRSDNLSAATHDLRRSRGRALTRRYRELLDHYGLRASLIQVGEAHENGVVEQAHRRTKSTLAQALLLRGSCDFGSVEDYEHWVRAVVEREHNSRLGERLLEERRHLQALPAAPDSSLHHTHRAGPPVEHDQSAGPDLLFTLSSHRRARHRTTVRRSSRGLLPRAIDGAPAAPAPQGPGPHRLPARNPDPGAQTRGVCPLPLARGVIPKPGVSPRL